MSRLSFAQMNVRQLLRVFPRPLRLSTLLLLLVLGVLCYSMICSFTRGTADQHDVARLQREVAQAQQRKAQLLQVKRDLSTPEGAVKIARENGMVKHGEYSVRIPPIHAATSAPPSTPIAEPPAEITTEGILLAGIILFLLAFCAGVGYCSTAGMPRAHDARSGALTPRSELRRRPRHAHER